jgi:carbon monoxide dehydrogenase subunit G
VKIWYEDHVIPSTPSATALLSDPTRPPYGGSVSTAAYVIDYRASFDFDVPPPVIWQTIEQCDRFENWWAWLKEFRLEGSGLREGSVLHGLVVPPVPYRMRLRVELDNCNAPNSIDATVHGDLEGTAQLKLEPNERGTRAKVSWTIEMTQRPMRLASRFARPLLVWGHDRVVEATVASLRRHLDDDSRPEANRVASRSKPNDRS